MAAQPPCPDALCAFRAGTGGVWAAGLPSPPAPPAAANRSEPPGSGRAGGRALPGCWMRFPDHHPGWKDKPQAQDSALVLLGPRGEIWPRALACGGALEKT